LNREQLLSEAGDLDRLCRPRDLRTPEVFPPNAFYGTDLVLKLRAGLPPDQPLKAVAPHGIVFDRSYVWEMERRALLPAVLAYSDQRAQAYARATGKLVIRSAVPFAYLPMLAAEAASTRRSGMLFFPSHSSHRATAHADFAGMAEALTRLEAKYQPVTVCIYWRDHQLGHHRPFVERGLPVVSAGHIFDSMFLFRLFHLCRRHRYAAGNHVGSSLFYAALAGCRYFLLPGFGATYSGAHEHLAQDVSLGGPLQDEVASAFAAPSDEVSPLQHSLLTRICGLDHLLEPAQLRAALEMADRLDRFGVARDPFSGGTRVAVPRAGMRACANSLLAARRLAGRLLRRWRPA
jgi:hypothetical protein